MKRGPGAGGSFFWLKGKLSTWIPSKKTKIVSILEVKCHQVI